MRRWARAAGWLLAAGVALTAVTVQGRQEPGQADDAMQQVEREVERSLRVFGDRGSQIGVSIRDLEPGASPAASGAQVEEVREESPAAKAGLQRGDIITEFDGERVRSARQLSRLVMETPAGRTVGVKVMRAGRQVQLEVTPDADGRMFGRQMRVMPKPQFQFEMPKGVYGSFVPRPWSGRARLGVSIQEMTTQLAEYFGTKDGVLVTTVRDGSPAEKAGLKAGDVITAVNGRPVTSPSDLTEGVQEAGDTAKISYVRDRKTAEVEVQLPAREQQERRRPVRPV